MSVIFRITALYFTLSIFVTRKQIDPQSSVNGIKFQCSVQDIEKLGSLKHFIFSPLPATSDLPEPHCVCVVSDWCGFLYLYRLGEAEARRKEERASPVGLEVKKGITVTFLCIFLPWDWSNTSGSSDTWTERHEKMEKRKLSSSLPPTLKTVEIWIEIYNSE